MERYILGIYPAYCLGIFIEKIEAFTYLTDDLNPAIQHRIANLYEKAGGLIERAHLKEALAEIFAFVRFCNKYYDERQPWQQIHEDRNGCQETLNNCLNMIANLAQLLSPFLPFSSDTLKRMLQFDDFAWQPITDTIHIPKQVDPLFQRIDPTRINEELERLRQAAKA